MPDTPKTPEKIDPYSSKRMLWFGGIVLLLGGLLALFAPYLLTRSIGILDFSQTGQIGDTIGGITAPILNLTGSILIFLALRAQINANQIIQNQITDETKESQRRKNFEQLLELVRQLREDIREYSFIDRVAQGFERVPPVYQTYTGLEAFNKTFVNFRHIHTEEMGWNNGKFTEYYLLLDFMLRILGKSRTQNINNEDAEFIQYSILNIYFSKFDAQLSIVGHNEFPKCNICSDEPHFAYKKLLEIYEEFEQWRHELKGLY